jgi:hypothetical protein
MPLARLAALLAAGALTTVAGSGLPARAQDYPFQGFAAMDAMNTLHANVRDATLRASGADNRPRQWRNIPRDQRHGGAPAPTTPASTATLTFRRDAAVTRQVQAEMVRTVSRTAPEAGQTLAQTFATGDPIATAAPFFRRYGLDTANVVDAVTIYHLAMWGVANNQEAQMTPVQARGARAHVERAVDWDGMGLTTAAARQRFADTLIYQGLLMDAAIEQAQKSGDQAMQRTLSDAAHGQMLGLGLDMRRLSITGDGFVAR